MSRDITSEKGDSIMNLPSRYTLFCGLEGVDQ